MTSTEGWKDRRAAEFARHAYYLDCKNCGWPIIRGLDADVAAFSVTVDADPVSLTQEQAAIRAGLRSYDLTGGGTTLWHRLDRHIAAPQPSRTSIHIQHRC